MTELELKILYLCNCTGDSTCALYVRFILSLLFMEGDGIDVRGIVVF